MGRCPLSIFCSCRTPFGDYDHCNHCHYGHRNNCSCEHYLSNDNNDDDNNNGDKDVSPMIKPNVLGRPGGDQECGPAGYCMHAQVPYLGPNYYNH